MEHFVVGSRDVTAILETIVKKLNVGNAALFQIPIEFSEKVNSESIAVLQALGFNGIYISLTKDYNELSQLLMQRGVDMERLHVIDGISEMYGIAKVQEKPVSYVEGPLRIDDISHLVEKLSEPQNETKKFVFLDSLTTVLLYNSLDRTLNFCNFLFQSINHFNLLGFFTSVSTGNVNNQLIDELKQSTAITIDFRSELSQVLNKG